MRVFHYSAGYDTGGQGIRMKHGFDRHSEVEFRTAARRTSYIDYPTDAPIADAARLGQEADVMHVSHRIPPFRRRDGQIDRIGQGKPTVVHYHGTGFRKHHMRRLAEAEKVKATKLVATLDLLLYAPDAIWCPAPYNLDWLAEWRDPQPEGPLRVVHTPTSRTVKSTDLLIEAVELLRKDHPVKLNIVERVNWETSLFHKGFGDVYFDQTILGYGNNAIEAWGMGLPVIAGASEYTRRLMLDRFGGLPFYRAEDTVESIRDALAAMIEPETRALWSKLGKEHVERFHSEERVVRLLESVYEKTLARF